jgi:glycine cleavage system H protein
VRYTSTHEWVEAEDEGIVTVGISNQAQQAFGEVVYVEPPEEGEEFEQDEPMGNIESRDGNLMIIHAPITGEVIEVNSALETSPDLMNRSPEGDGWFVRMRMEVPAELETLMTLEEYEEYEEEILEQEEIFEDEEEEDF